MTEGTAGTRDEILAMAMEAGLVKPWQTDYAEDFVKGEIEALERLVHLAQAAAYEQAAQLCENEDIAPSDDAVGVCECIAVKIRALKEKSDGTCTDWAR